MGWGLVLTFILGTRPEAIKIRPLLREAKARKIPFKVILTGQHTDLLHGTGVTPTLNLHIPSENDPLAYVETVTTALVHHLDGTKSVSRATVVVQGDTASALAGARAASQLSIPVAHVEAGLRSHDPNDPWPEELFRIEIDALADFHFCPTAGNAKNVSRELWEIGAPCGVAPRRGLTPDHIQVTGNTITDALRLAKLSRNPRNHILVTLHRRESAGEPMSRILKGLTDFALNHPTTMLILINHPNGLARWPENRSLNCLDFNPLPYPTFLTYLSSAACVLTDSGGLIEETSTLGIPCVIARNHTERPEALSEGSAFLAGTSSASITQALTIALHAQPHPSTVYGDGFVSPRILNLLIP